MNPVEKRKQTLIEKHGSLDNYKAFVNKRIAEGLRVRGIKQHGSEKAWRHFMIERGRRAGSAKVPKGFAINGLARKASRKRWGKK